MLPEETARWFRRSPSWLRQQADLLRLGAAAGQQPLYHVHLCRAYVLGKICGFTGDALRDIQLSALASVCGLPPTSCGTDGVGAEDYLNKTRATQKPVPRHPVSASPA